MSVANPGNPPWPTPDGKGDWLSDEYDPQAAVTDGKWVYLAAPGSELGYSIIAVDETGQRQWGIRSTSDGRAVSLALNGNYLYAIYSGAELTDGTRAFTGKNGIGKAVLMCFDKRTGKPVQFTLKQPNQVVANWPYRNDYTWLDELRNNRSFTPAVYGGQPRYFHADVGETTNALGLAAVGNKLYLSLNYDNKLLVIDAAAGNQPVRRSRSTVRWACVLSIRTILAVSGKQVVKVDVADQSRDAADHLASGRARQRRHRQGGQHLRQRLGHVIPGQGLQLIRKIPSRDRQGRRTPLGGQMGRQRYARAPRHCRH